MDNLERARNCIRFLKSKLGNSKIIKIDILSKNTASSYLVILYINVFNQFLFLSQWLLNDDENSFKSSSSSTQIIFT